ncbi:MAG: MBL fold metallo-hydrolase [Gemmatimonadota bacterium]|jgi:glyoxylase-like metal-dependent hydrolase (beta-lactamase superfamily II)
MIHRIDLEHLGLRGAIALYVIPDGEPTVVDPGPSTTLERLRDGLAGLGIGARDLRHIVLTHVHLDHAGATGHLVDLFPQARVYVHADGAPHMVDPARLVASTRRTFGEAHDRLWGEVKPVPAERIRTWSQGEPGPLPGLVPLPTPGHIAHHLAYLHERDGTLLSGDAMGIVLADDAPTHPPTPPPSVDLRAWQNTLDEIATVGPERFGATHFGLHGEVQARVGQLRERLTELEARVRAAMARGDDEDAERYDREVRDALAPHVGREEVDRYFDMFTAATDWAGVKFYLERNP